LFPVPIGRPPQTGFKIHSGPITKHAFRLTDVKGTIFYKKIDPATIAKTYGVEGMWDPENAICNFSKTYLLRISLSNGLINGSTRVEDHAEFFVVMARQR